MMIEQMELGLGKGRVCPSVNRRQRRLSRANWWFDRMRQAVEGALDRQPPPPPPEQVWMELPRFRRAA